MGGLGSKEVIKNASINSVRCSCLLGNGKRKPDVGIPDEKRR